MPLFTVRFRSLFASVVALLAMALPAGAHVPASSALAPNRTSPEHVLYSFQGDSDGAWPRSTLVADASGDLFGTTQIGGSGSCPEGCGTVFELIPRAGGSGYQERIVYRFQGSADGANPEAGLTVDAQGALYGTTFAGGNGCFSPGCGTVFKLAPQTGGAYLESVIYSFSGGSDGGSPIVGLLLDAHGDLIGAAAKGSKSAGVVYELSPSGRTYAQRVLYTFATKSPDGANPSSPLIADGQGDLYGSTAGGGSAGFGTVYRLSPSAKSYTETTLYNFSGGADGASPGPLAFGPGGVVYGTAYSGGKQGAGVVFALLPMSKNAYAEKTIQMFSTVGAEPDAGVYVDGAGVVYGTTAFGGLPGCSNGGGCGIVFHLTPSKNGFSYGIMHVFGGGRDGSEPLGGLIPGPGGELYGTTYRGGTGNYGTVYRIK